MIPRIYFLSGEFFRIVLCLLTTIKVLTNIVYILMAKSFIPFESRSVSSELDKIHQLF
jgi:hypothetical protein